MRALSITKTPYGLKRTRRRARRAERADLGRRRGCEHNAEIIGALFFLFRTKSGANTGRPSRIDRVMRRVVREILKMIHERGSLGRKSELSSPPRASSIVVVWERSFRLFIRFMRIFTRHVIVGIHHCRATRNHRSRNSLHYTYCTGGVSRKHRAARTYIALPRARDISERP